MSSRNLQIAPDSGLTSTWLKEIYITHVARSKAVGKDGVRPRAFLQNLDAECELIASKVNDGSYTFTNYREKLIARGATRAPRQISIPTIRDRLALRGALQYLKLHFPLAQPRPPHLYIKEIKAHLDIARDHSSFLRMDICDFYPSLSHDRLQEVLQRSDIPETIVNLIIKAITTKTGPSDQPRPVKGVPQGLSISNALAAIYMADFDLLGKNDIFYRRYVDDILVIDRSENVNSTYAKLWKALTEIGLTSHPMGTSGKTETKLLAEGVQYLGYEIFPNQISIRPNSLAKMFSNLAKVLTCFKYKKEHARHIFRLNLKITGCVINNTRRGWLMFFSQTDNVSQISHLDSWLKQQLLIYKIDGGAIKNFKKSYYEIKYNMLSTEYIPNFDKFSLEQKQEVVSILSSRTLEQVATMDVLMVESEFNRLVGREVSELERDLVDAFS